MTKKNRFELCKNQLFELTVLIILILALLSIIWPVRIHSTNIVLLVSLEKTLFDVSVKEKKTQAK